MRKTTIFIWSIILLWVCTDITGVCQVANNIDKLEFTYQQVAGIGHENGCTRRDPSDIILVNDTFYIYYTKVIGRSEGYWGTIWCATSLDTGRTWTERGEVLGHGKNGSFDAHAVFTPNIIRANGKYYLFYTGVKPTPGRTDGMFENNSRNDKTAIGLAASSTPLGPFTRVSESPALLPSADPEKFDSYRVDDASLLWREGKYWLYYKGRSKKDGKSGPAHTEMGVAYSSRIEGPYTKYEKPILPQSHEVFIWPYQNGVAALASISSTLEFAPDGLDFLSHKQSIKIDDRPNAPGAYRPDLTQADVPHDGINWGISMIHHGKEAYLIRFNAKKIKP